MNDREMEGVARQALNMMKRDAEQGRFRFFFGVYYDGSGLRRLRRTETLIDKIVGADWLEVGRKKDAAFDIMREAIGVLAASRLAPGAVIFGAAANMFKMTPQFDGLPRERQKEIVDGDGERRRRAVREGYLTYHDSLTCWVHTPARVCFCAQENGDPEVEMNVCDQNDVYGRQKFFKEAHESA